jgi:ubiquinone/menaquinone biosynthesis C-methylase UbiE
VLDVGCGTGRVAATLVERYACKVWGVDPSPEMLEVARANVPDAVGLKLASAEELPFKDGWFERAVSTLVVHHLDRARAFPELRRVLASAGRFVFATFDPAYFETYYLNRYFPSILELDLARFAPADVLERELRDAGFADVRTSSLQGRRALARDDVLRNIRGKHISTFQLLSNAEYREGLARAERELPERVEWEYHWLVLAAATA